MDRPFPTITGYRILSQLGEGGMGAIFLAEDEELGRKVAIKAISERILKVAGSGARFQREARTMATLEHPNIVHVYAFQRSEGRSYLIMEYVDGDVLSQRIRRSGQMAVEETLKIARQIVLALEAAWEKKIVHRDIKPANILIDQRGQVRVVDFGLAKPLDSSEVTLTQAGATLGTPQYLSPEQALGRDLDYRSDVYSLGILLYEMLAGEPPFHGNTAFDIVRKHLSEPLPSLKERRADVPVVVDKMLEWMTQKDPGDRPTYRQLRQRIDSFLAGGSDMTTSGADLQMKHVVGASRLPAFQILPARIQLWLGRLVAGVLILAIAFFTWNALKPARETKQQAIPVMGQQLVVAVTPFYGPDPDSQQEGRVMAALIEKSVSKRLKEDARVIGQEETRMVIRDHESAQELGRKLGANAVIWGETLALRNETEIQPHFTLIREPDIEEQRRWQTSSILEDPLIALSERTSRPVLLSTETPNQIELRKTTASGVGEIAVLLAGIHSLYREDDVEKALRYFSEISQTAESLYYRAVALMRQEKTSQALASLQEALTLDPEHAPSHALLGDHYLADSKRPEALASYTAAWKAGQTYTSRRGFFYADRFYETELLTNKRYTEGKPYSTSYLLETDPQSGKVLQRYSLPGIPEQFTVRKGGVEISCNSGYGLENDVIFSEGKFNRPPDYAEDLILRLQSMQAGWTLAANFLGDLESTDYLDSPKFAPSDSYEDVPDTFNELEVALRTAWEKDGTQPWHLFFLGQVFWAQGERKHAEQTWEEVFTKSYDGTPYYEFAWMAFFFERLRQPEWADRAYWKALKRRKELVAPADYCSLAEKLVNTGFIRQAVWASQRGVDLPRQHLWLERSRELVGVSYEGEDFAAAAWKKYFRRLDNSDKSIREAGVFQKAQQHPLNLIRTTTHLDYAFYLLVASTLGLLCYLVSLLIRAGANSISAGPAPAIPRLSSPFLRSMLFLLLTALILFPFWWLYQIGSLELTIIAVIAAMLLSGFVLRSKTSPRRLIASIPLEGRIVLIVAYLLFLSSLAFSISRNYELQSILSRPFRVSDATANPSFVYEMEQKLKESNQDQLRFATAVANHLAGNRKRARQLYESLPENPRAQKHLDSLKKDIFLPPVLPSTEEQFRVYTELPWKSRLSQLWSPGKSLNIFALDAGLQSNPEDALDEVSFFFRMLILLAGVLILCFLIVPCQVEVTQRTVGNIFRSRIGKSIFFFIPGGFDLYCRSFWKGFLILTSGILVSFSLLTIWLIPNPFPLPGIVTLLQMPNFLHSLPFPTEAGFAAPDAMVGYHYWTIFWSYADARIFWGIVTALGCVSLGFHVFRFRQIWRM